jgi:ABC-2 type transport system permease protein
MRSILTMAVKDLVLATRDLLGLFFIIGFPVLMGLFFGSMYSGVGERGGAKVDLAVVDEDGSPMSEKFLKSLDDNDGVNVDLLARNEAIDRVRRGDLVGLIAIPKGFGETAGLPWLESPPIELGVDPSRQAEGAMLQGLVMKAAGGLMMDRMQNPATLRPMIADAAADIAGSDKIPPATRALLQQMMTSLDGFLGSWEQVQTAEKATERATDADASDSTAGQADAGGFQLVEIKTIDVTHVPEPGSTEALVAKLRTRWDISFPQAMLWGVLGCAAAFAVSIVRERKQGTLLRLTAAPVSRTQILLGKALACFFAVLLVIAMMTALGAVLGMRPRSPALLLLASVCVAAAFVGVSILMSVIGRTEESVGGAAWGLNSVMAMFGGGMIPLAFMPAFMRPLSHASPVKWSILSLEGAIWRGFTLAEMMPPCAILLAFGAATLALGALRLSRMTD